MHLECAVEDADIVEKTVHLLAVLIMLHKIAPDTKQDLSSV